MALRDRCHESLACRMLGEYQLAVHRDGGKGQHAQLHRLVQHVEDLEPVLFKARIGSTGAPASRLRSASQLMQPHVQRADISLISTLRKKRRRSAAPA